MLFILPLSGITRIDLFYRNDADTGVYNLIINSSATWYSTSTFDYSGAAFVPDVVDSVNGQPKGYIQTMGGVTTQILIPGLKDFLDSNFLVNKAELILPVEPGSKGIRTPPSLMFLLKQTGEGRDEPIIDYSATEGTRVNGRLTYTDFRKAYYQFNITRHIFQVMNGQTTHYPLRLQPTAQEYTPYRVILNGTVDPNWPMRLDIYYAKVKNP